jgi:hypothetical protein
MIRMFYYYVRTDSPMMEETGRGGGAVTMVSVTAI